MNETGDNYGTPLDLYIELNDRFHFRLDPCAWIENRLSTANWFTEKDDGLLQSWYPGPIFMNPPYSNPAPWCNKAYDQSLLGSLTVGLLRHDPSTRWWNNWIKDIALVIPIPYRLKFVNYETKEQVGSYNFPSAIVIWTGLFQLGESK